MADSSAGAKNIQDEAWQRPLFSFYHVASLTPVLLPAPSLSWLLWKQSWGCVTAEKNNSDCRKGRREKKKEKRQLQTLTTLYIKLDSELPLLSPSHSGCPGTWETLKEYFLISFLHFLPLQMPDSLITKKENTMSHVDIITTSVIPSPIFMEPNGPKCNLNKSLTPPSDQSTPLLSSRAFPPTHSQPLKSLLYVVSKELNSTLSSLL